LSSDDRETKKIETQKVAGFSCGILLIESCQLADCALINWKQMKYCTRRDRGVVSNAKGGTAGLSIVRSIVPGQCLSQRPC
jgi:hypothetical protein